MSFSLHILGRTNTVFARSTIKSCINANSFGLKALFRSMSSQKKVAVVLSGCGVYDGTEVHEASSCLVHLSREGSAVSMFAPDIDQMHVINHLNGDVMSEKRNVLIESARIARGKAAPLSQLRASDFDAIIFPGGFGAAKNLCDFAVSGKDCMVQADTARVIGEFNKAGKPVGLCCIAPVLAAKLLPGCQVTMGSESEEGGLWPHAGATQAIGPLGGQHVIRGVTECLVDDAKKVVTTPAFMCEAPLHQIYEGVGALVREVLRLA
ncbi:hypothetical protein BOX15_Mlig016218g1 [Macrostomum lignano]|uniref:DJ-1_PfpI domain-containing protein n=1 Tax=Macrostomum lignano TaxID=282301 RepID=A0A267EVM2_9PLAT|nr:hypothetical protein BOX15_Mlig016218g2 [Macrostomum lignano]PAA71241.1 hypothetical protein BOX15_Mlig016218g1 [Macrostomum lignano]